MPVSAPRGAAVTAACAIADSPIAQQFWRAASGNRRNEHFAGGRCVGKQARRDEIALADGDRIETAAARAVIHQASISIAARRPAPR